MYAILNPRHALRPCAGMRDLSVWRTAQACVARILESDTVPRATHGRTGSLSWAASGTIFSFSERTTGSPEALAKRALQDPEAASRQFWGRYFLVAYDECRNRFFALTDPCGQHPVFYHRALDGSLHVGDRIEDFCSSGAVSGRPDLRFLRQYLAHGFGNPAQTAWADVLVLPPGQALFWQPGGAPETKRVWSPCHVANDREPSAFVDVLTMVLQAMFGDSADIVLELSGGLDSTALAVALREAGLSERTLALTYVDSKRSASDEVSMARQVAAFCGMKHATRSLLTRLPFSPVVRSPTVSRPTTKLCFLAHNDALVRDHIAAGTAELLNGNGGDSTFLSFPPFGVLIDVLRKLRFRKAISVLWDLAVFYRLPVWTVLARAIDDAVHVRAEAGADTPKCVSPAGRSRILPPGLYDDVLRGEGRRLRPGRRRQIAALGEMLDEALVQPYPCDRRPVMPFLSQPLVEYALSMPLEDTFSADHSRLTIRQQLFQISHLSNLWRKDKGDVMHAALLGIRMNCEHVRETCLGGWTALQGWTDRRNLEQAIRRLELGYPDGLAEVARVYAIEQFIRGLPDGRGGDLRSSKGGGW